MRANQKAPVIHERILEFLRQRGNAPATTTEIWQALKDLDRDTVKCALRRGKMRTPGLEAKISTNKNNMTNLWSIRQEPARRPQYSPATATVEPPLPQTETMMREATMKRVPFNRLTHQEATALTNWLVGMGQAQITAERLTVSMLVELAAVRLGRRVTEGNIVSKLNDAGLKPYPEPRKKRETRPAPATVVAVEDENDQVVRMHKNDAAKILEMIKSHNYLREEVVNLANVVLEQNKRFDAIENALTAPVRNAPDEEIDNSDDGSTLDVETTRPETLSYTRNGQHPQPSLLSGS